MHIEGNQQETSSFYRHSKGVTGDGLGDNFVKMQNRQKP